METVIITSLTSLLGTIATVILGQKSFEHKLDKHNAVQDERIKTLTERVEKHNNVIERTCSLEGRVAEISKVLNL